MVKYITDNWETILSILVISMPVFDAIVRLTPTKKDDTILSIIQKLLDKFLPNKKTGGGTH
ncbi:MAG: hypothetical protein JSR11_03650 [Bacteroidetes bacterium]|nr:hypothetical protein [Bacteroidota bacterium]